MTADSSRSTYRLHIYLLYLILHVPLSLLGPSILLNIFLSYEFIIFFSWPIFRFHTLLDTLLSYIILF
jgi:hypothetical protein